MSNLISKIKGLKPRGQHQATERSLVNVKAIEIVERVRDVCWENVLSILGVLKTSLFNKFSGARC